MKCEPLQDRAYLLDIEMANIQIALARQYPNKRDCPENIYKDYYELGQIASDFRDRYHRIRKHLEKVEAW